MATKKTTTKKQIEKISTLPVLHDGDAQDVFVDGVSGLLAGYPNSKLAFYVTVDSANGDEVRKNNLRLTMSTVAMLELFEALKETLIDNLQEVVNIAEIQRKQIATFSAQSTKNSHHSPNPKVKTIKRITSRPKA